MADRTVAFIRAQLEGSGYIKVPKVTLETILGQAYPDDDDFDAVIATWVASKDWVDRYVIEWHTQDVVFEYDVPPPPAP
jgi:hypothetical protein